MTRDTDEGPRRHRHHRRPPHRSSRCPRPHHHPMTADRIAALAYFLVAAAWTGFVIALTIR